MSRKQHIGSHNNHAHPDKQMRRRGESDLTTTQRQTMQRVANKKRRQRDIR